MTFQESTYASVIQKDSPTKEHATVLDAYEEITTKDYIFGKVINPTNVRFASRIANNKICMYLAGKSFVDKLMSGNTNIFIEDRLLSVRPLIMKTSYSLKRVSHYSTRCDIKHFQANGN